MMFMFCAMHEGIRDWVHSTVEGIRDVDLVTNFANDGLDGSDY